MKRAGARRTRDGVGKRRRAREIALQMLYQQELGGSSLEQIFSGYALEDYVGETVVAAAHEGSSVPREVAERAGARVDHSPRESLADSVAARPLSSTEQAELHDSFTYARQLVEGAAAHGEKIDELIRAHAENWRLERMPVIDRSILRLAVYEMLHQSAVPKVVIVDEAIELAKKFGSEHSGRFVNGLLDGILKSPAVLTACGTDPGATP